MYFDRLETPPTPTERQVMTKIGNQFKNISIPGYTKGDTFLVVRLEDEKGIWSGNMYRNGDIEIVYNLDNKTKHTYRKGRNPEATMLAGQAGFLIK